MKEGSVARLMRRRTFKTLKVSSGQVGGWWSALITGVLGEVSQDLATSHVSLEDSRCHNGDLI